MFTVVLLDQMNLKVEVKADTSIEAIKKVTGKDARKSVKGKGNILVYKRGIIPKRHYYEIVRAYG